MVRTHLDRTHMVVRRPRPDGHHRSL